MSFFYRSWLLAGLLTWSAADSHAQQRALVPAPTATPPALAAAPGGGGTTPPVDPVVATQMRSWAFDPFRVNFTTTPPHYGVLPNPSNNTAGNLTAAAYDPDNNVLFTVSYGGSQTAVIKDANGNPADSFGPYTSTSRQFQNASGFPTYYYYREWGTEMAVVPVPGTCRQFYLIYLQTSGPNCLCVPSTNAGEHSVLLRVTVDCSGATPTIVAGPTPIDETLLGRFGGIAVSKADASGNRTLVCVNRSSVKSFPITSAGIGSPFSTYSTAAVISSIDPVEVDLSPDGTKLALTSSGYSGSAFYVADVATNGVVSNLRGVAPTAFGSYSGIYTYGAEFSSDSKKIYYAGKVNSNPVRQGVFELTLQTNQVQQVPNSGVFGTSQLELGLDGMIYGASSSTGQLGYIHPGTNVVTTATPYSVVVPFPVSPGFMVQPVTAFSGYRALPDQIDGQDYSYFFGSGVAAKVGAPRLGNVVLTNGVVRNVYGCQGPVLLTATVSNAVSLDVSITPLSTGGVPTGPAISQAVAPTLNVDLLSLFGGYLAANPGAYQLKLEATNSCGFKVRQSGLFHLSNAAPEAKFDFGTGIDAQTQASSQDPQQPTEVGGLGGALVLTAAVTGGVDYLEGYIEYYDPSTGNVSPVCGSSTFPYTTTNGRATIPLNEFAVCNGPDFFAQPAQLNKTFRLTFTLHNACGVSGQGVGYFTPVSAQYRAAAPSPKVAVAAPTAPALYPNPLVAGQAHFQYSLSRPQHVELRIVESSTGLVRLRLVNGLQTAGTHTVNFDAAPLPKGLYLYQLVTDRVQTGRFSKQD
jgi:hypothetical protein